MELKIFENNAFGRVRVIELDNEPMFLGKDIAMCLGYKDTSGAIATHCKSGKKVFQQHANGVGGVNVIYISESDVYRLIMRSNLPSADKFQDWVCDEILPSIRKHGIYATDDTIDKMINSPEFGIKLLTALQEERKAKAEAEAKLEEQRLKNKELSVSFEAKSIELEKSNETIGTLMETSETYKATDIAKELGLTSASALNAKLKDMKIQYRQGKDWYFYAEYSDKGYDSLKQHILPNGTATYTRTFTQAGRAFILEKFKEYRAKQRASVRQRPSRSNK